MQSNMEEKTPNPEKRSPHLRFFHAMEAIEQILKAKWLEATVCVRSGESTDPEAAQDDHRRV